PAALYLHDASRDFFFFSSRRRHTRSKRDWSSDVCSSDLQIVSSGPDSEWEQIKYGYIKMILTAKEYIYIQTPYFIPDESLMDALRIAALSGVKIKLMIPNK